MNRMFDEVLYIRPGSVDLEAIHTARAATTVVLANGGGGPPKDESGFNAKRPEKDRFGDAIAQMQMIGDVAVVPVHGAIYKWAKGSDKWFSGCCSHQDIHEDLDAAVAKKPRAIVMHMNSPGGTMVGTQGVADHVAAIAASGMKIVSYTEDQKCSAAEYITAPCTARLATPDAIVGSIGTIMITASYEKMLKEFGIEVNVFASGKFKGAGNPYKDLTPDQKKYLQELVDGMGDTFKGHMAKYRPGVKAASMEGQVFLGSQAARNGLIDATVNNFSEVLEFVQ